MSTLRAIKSFLVMSRFVMIAMLFVACSARVVPTVVSNQTKFIPLGYADGSVQVCDATTGKIDFTVRGHSSHVWALAWSPDGNRLASGSWDTTVQIWNATTGYEIFTYRGHSNIISAVTWSPDGKRIASVDDQMRVWGAS